MSNVRKIFLRAVRLLALAVLLSGCDSGLQNDSPLQTEDPSSAAAQAEESRSAPEAESSGNSRALAELPEEAGRLREDSGTAGFSSPEESAEEEAPPIETITQEEERTMVVQIGESTFTAALEENAAVDALVDMMEQGPVTIQMSDYSGFEKVGPLGTSLPASNQQTTTQAGDIVLYQGDQIVLFYGSNSWSYTRLGRIDDLSGWEEALGSGDVAVTFSLEG